MAPQVSIIGAGVAGLVLGQLLRRRQIHAIIWEKSKQFPPTSLQNFGITLHAPTYTPLLQRLGVDEQTFFDDLGIKHTSTYKRDESIRVNRSAWLRSLSKDLDIRWEHKLTNTVKTSSGHRLTFTSGEQELSHEADLVVVTDGVHSASREAQHLSANAFELKVLPYIVFNGKRTFKLDAAPDGLIALLDAPSGLSRRIGSILLQLTSGYVDASNNEFAINYTLSRPATDADDRLLGRGKADAESLAKQFIDEASRLQALDEPFQTVFAPANMKDDRLLHWLMRSGLISTKEHTRLAHDGIVLVGDAAHPQPILGGDGANHAVSDAIGLAEAIKDDGLDFSLYDRVSAGWGDAAADAQAWLAAAHQPGPSASL